MHTLVLEVGTDQVISIQVEENGADEKEFVVGKGALIGYIAKNPIYIYVNRQKYMGMFIGEDNVDTNSIECIVVEKLSYFVNKSFVFQWKNDYIILKDVSN
jgi:hypothetical protein